nr:hypothetical protein [Tanacetum cinerariifolium]
MANPVQNINHWAFMLMFEREKLSGNNFNDWFRQLKLVLRVEKKMHFIEQPILPAPAADSAVNMLVEWNAVYDAHNEVACLMLRSMTPELHRQFKNYSPYEMLQKLRSMFEKQAGVESVGLILNGPTSDFAGFVRNYNMRNIGKTIGELHDLLIEYEKGLPKKAVTPQVIAIQVYDNGCGTHICITKQGLRGARKLKQGDLYLYVGNGVRAQVKAICFTDFGISVSKNNVLYFNAIPSNGIYEIDMSNPVPKVNSIYNVSNKRVKHNLDSTYLWHCRLAHMSKKRIEKLQQDGLLKSTNDESFDQCVYCLSGKMTRKSFPHCPERATDVLGLIHTDVCGPLRHVSRQEAAARILNMFPTKKVDKTPYELWFGKVPNLSYLKVWGCEALVKRDTPDKLQQRSVKCIFIGYPKETIGCYFYFSPKNKIVVARYAEFFEKNLLSQEVSGRAGDLEEIQDEDTSPSEITSEIPMEVEGFEPPQEEKAPVYRFERPHQAPDRLCLNVEVEEHSLGDLNEPANYKAVMLDPEYDKWLDAMNTEMQPMKDNQTYLGKCFAMKDLGEATFILGIKIYRDRLRRLIGLCQSAYMDKILKRCRMDYSKRGYIPMQERLDLNKTQGASKPGEVKRMQNVPYASAVGSIIVECYCDAAFETDRDDTKSQTVYVFILNGGAVDWKSSKKSTTAMSATEAEYIAASEAGMEAVWIRKFISGLGIVPTINEPIRMFCDNSAALHFANEPGVQKGARHFHREYHYVCECIKLGEIKFLKVHTNDNLADPFTKALSFKKLTQHAKSMGLHLASSFM